MIPYPYSSLTLHRQHLSVPPWVTSPNAPKLPSLTFLRVRARFTWHCWRILQEENQEMRGTVWWHGTSLESTVRRLCCLQRWAFRQRLVRVVQANSPAHQMCLHVIFRLGLEGWTLPLVDTPTSTPGREGKKNVFWMNVAFSCLVLPHISPCSLDDLMIPFLSKKTPRWFRGHTFSNERSRHTQGSKNEFFLSPSVPTYGNRRTQEPILSSLGHHVLDSPSNFCIFTYSGFSLLLRGSVSLFHGSSLSGL